MKKRFLVIKDEKGVFEAVQIKFIKKIKRGKYNSEEGCTILMNDGECIHSLETIEEILQKIEN